jgi:hypothetical protein
MSRTWVYVSAAAGVVAPVVMLIDLAVFRQSLFRNELLILSLWPSAFMLSGVNSWNIEVAIGLLISIAINMLLYVGAAFLLSKIVSVFLRVRRP